MSTHNGSAVDPKVYRPADQAVIEDGDVLRLVVIVDDEPPTDSHYRIQLLAPVKAEVGQPALFTSTGAGSGLQAGRAPCSRRSSPRPG